MKKCKFIDSYACKTVVTRCRLFLILIQAKPYYAMLVHSLIAIQPKSELGDPSVFSQFSNSTMHPRDSLTVINFQVEPIHSLFDPELGTQSIDR